MTAFVGFLRAHLSFFLLSHINWFMSLLTPGFNIQPLFSSYMCEPPFPSPTPVPARDDKAKSTTICLVAGTEEEYVNRVTAARLTSQSKMLDGDTSRAKQRETKR